MNSLEREALLHTFGDWTGNYLINVIDVQIDAGVEGGQVRNNTQIFLNPLYVTDGENGADLGWLSVFIHEAAHIWQRHTGLHGGGRGGEDYVYNTAQLMNLDLKKEEHASAVQDWFFVSYGLKKGLIGGDAKTSFAGAWGALFTSMGWDKEAISTLNLHADHWKSSEYLGAHVNYFYKRVVEEIKNPNLVPPVILGQNFPNPF